MWLSGNSTDNREERIERGGLAEQACALVVGDPMAAETTMGPLVSPYHRATVPAEPPAG